MQTRPEAPRHFPKKMKSVVLFVALAALSVPAEARQRQVFIFGDSYYVAHKVPDSTCVVFHKRPTGAWTIVGVFKTFGQAAATMKSAPDCVDSLTNPIQQSPGA